MWRLPLTFLVLCLLLAGPADARRAALVIGNSVYEHAGRLANPTNDAAAVAAAFRRLQFEHVTHLDNLGADKLRRALSDFSAQAANADIAVVYFAGHGIEVDGQNYLIPVDARLASAAVVEIETIPLATVTSVIASASRLRLVILDSCRNNPFRARMISGTSGRSRSIGRGLARVEPSENELIAFAAAGGTEADDGSGQHSPFTEALLKSLEMPGLEVRLLFGAVRDDVVEATRRRQTPHVYGTLGRQQLYLAAPAAAPKSDEAYADLAGVIASMTDRGRVEALTRHSVEVVRKAAQERLSALAAPASPAPAETMPASSLAASDGTRAVVLKRAKEIAAKVDAPAARGDALTAIAAALVPSGQFAEILALREQALREADAGRSPDWRATLHAGLGVALSKLGRSSEAALQFEEALRLVSMAPADTRGITLNGIAEEQALAGLKAEAKIGFVRAQAAILQDDDLFSRAYKLEMVAASEANYGMVSEALETLAKARETGLASGNDYFDPARAAVQIAEILHKAGLKAEAADTLTRAWPSVLAIKNDYMRPRAAAQIAEAQAAMSLTAASATSFDEAVKIATAIADEGTRDYAIAAVAASQATVGNTEAAKRIAASLANDSVRATAFRDVVTALASAGRFEDALRVEPMITDPNERVRALIDVGAAYAARGRSDDADSQLRRGLALAAEITDLYWRALLMGDVAVGFVRAGLARQAEAALAAAMKEVPAVDAGLRGYVMIHLANAQAKAGMLAQAAATFDSARMLAQSDTDAEARARRLQEIESERAKAPNAADEMLPAIVEAHAHAGRVADAVRVALSRKGDQEGDQLLQAIVTILTATGRTAAAAGILPALRTADYRVRAHLAIAEAHKKAGASTDADAAIDGALTNIALIQDGQSRAGALYAVLELALR